VGVEVISHQVDDVKLAVLLRSGKWKGDEIVFQCPYPEKHQHGDRTPSAEYNPSKGVWHCFGCGAEGTSSDLAAALHLDVGSGNGGDAPPRGIKKTWGSDPLTAWWVYRDQIGRELGVVARYDGGGKKQVIPYFNVTDGTWAPGAPKALGPLYGLEWLAKQPDATIIVVEGEKCACALQKMMLLGVTSQGGSSSASKADWRPVAGRNVVIWPDHDEPGQKYAKEVMSLCQSVGCASVVVFDETQLNLEPGGDVVDWLALHPEARRAEVVALLGIEEGKKFGLIRLSLTELLALDVPPKDAIVDPWLKTKDLVMIYAWRGSGKTYFGLTLAWSLVTGTDFMKWAVPKPRSVLYVDGEMPIESLKLRLSKIIAGNQSPQLARLDFIAADVQERPIPSLATKGGQKLIEEHLSANHYDVIMLDNVSTLCRGTDEENSAESWVPVQEWLLSLRRKGYTVELMHHAAKGGQQRGTSSREDVLDTVVCLERPHDYEDSDGARFVFRFQKSRGLDGKSVKPIEAKLVDGQDGGVTWGYKDCKEDQSLRIKELYTVDKFSTTEIASELKISKSTVCRALKAAGILVRGRHG